VRTFGRARSRVTLTGPAARTFTCSGVLTAVGSLCPRSSVSVRGVGCGMPAECVRGLRWGLATDQN